MQAFVFALTVLLVSVSFSATAGEPPAASDSRIPVSVSPEGAQQQKAEMRENLVALRDTLAQLAASDFTGVEASVRKLGHSAPLSARPGFSTAAFADLERRFERSVDLAAQAARSGNSARVLTALSETMAYCQSCHSAFRQAVEESGGTAAPATAR